ncbi:MAG: Transporter, major facilitator family [Parcubacteria group bacterium GW2011_GWA2_47_26]|nr:MAG: Transporter, major facilitator family [Parcubacteria group bacterium GW2011_GWA2_47_26]
MILPRNPKIPRNVFVVAFVALFSGFGQDLITPVLPAFMTALGLSRAGIGLIDGLLQGATSIFRFISGILSDRFSNRKFFVFLGYTLSSIARPLLALTGSLAPIATLRTIDGVGKGMKDAPRDALVADSAVAQTRGRAFGFHRLIDTIGSVFGPLLAAGLLFALTPALRTYRIIFALAIIPGAIALILILFGIREPKPSPRARAELRQKFSWKFWLFTAGIAIAMLTKINDSLFLVRAQDTGIPQAWIPVLFAGFTLLYALLSYPLGIWSDRIGKLPLITSGWLVLALVEFGFAKAPSILLTLTLFALYGLFFALTEGSGRAFIADLVPQGARGSAYAIFHTIVGLGVIIGGYGLGRIWDTISPAAAFRFASLGSTLGFLVLLILLIKTRKTKLSD